MPTDADIQKVKNNLANMQAFNDYLYNYGNPLIANCYALLSEKDTSDKGVAVVINMMCSSFWAMAAIEAGPVGAISANTFCGILSAWANGSSPPDMSETFSTLILRFQAASVDLDQQLAVYRSDPATYWNQTFIYNGQTCTLGDLATIDFPAEGDPDFFTLMNPDLWALDQYIWKFVLTNGAYLIADWEPAISMPTSFDFTSWQYSFYGAHPSYWATCEYHQDTGSCGDSSCYYLTEYNLSTGAGTFGDGHIPDAACNYLFADRAPGQTYPECTRGLYPRLDVFTTWGLRVKQIWSAYQPAPSSEDAKYLRAKRDGKPVLSDLLAEIGAEGIKIRILDALKADPSLRASLRLHPRETMARVLGVAVPQSVEFTFVPEGPRQYALVLPWDPAEGVIRT
jgi:hypothetical protein